MIRTGMQNIRIARTIHAAPGRRQSGYTLLEVVLALSLSVIVLTAIAMAIHIHLNVLEKRRNRIERAQLAKSILQMVSRDVRNGVQYKPVDMSQLEAMLGGADLMALMDNPAAGAAAESFGDGGLNVDDMLNSALSGMGGLGGDEMGASSDIAGTVSPPTEPGIYGNATELQIDISRLPRKDEYNPLFVAAGQSGDVPSDIKTIAYYVSLDATEATEGDGELAALGLTGGLVRRRVDRAVARFVSDGGGVLDGVGTVEVIAPEVTEVTFRYFDGTDWVSEWNSDDMGGLPMAIEISIVLTDLDGDPGANQGSGLQAEGETFRTVVHLPIAEPIDASESESMEQSGSEDPATEDPAGAGGAGGQSGGGDAGGPGGIDSGGLNLNTGGGGFSSGAGSAEGRN